MPKHVRSIECCYCSASTLVNLREVDEKSLKCGECGAGMAVGKMARVSEAPDAAGWNGEIPRRPERHSSPRKDHEDDRRSSKEWKGKREWRRDDDDDYKRSKPKKKKGFFDRLEDIWDEVEDIFD